MSSKIKVGTKVFHAPHYRYVIFGTVVGLRNHGGWAQARVDWNIPHEDYEINEWHNLVNLGAAEELLESLGSLNG